MRRRNMTREQRAEQIMRVFDVTNTSELTACDVARIINMSSSTYLREILHDLTRAGKLKARRVVHRRLATGPVYKDLYRRADAKKSTGQGRAGRVRYRQNTG